MTDAAKRLIGGIHSVRTAIRHGAGGIDTLWFDRGRRDKRLGQLLSEARKAGLIPRAWTRRSWIACCPMPTTRG